MEGSPLGGVQGGPTASVHGGSILPVIYPACFSSPVQTLRIQDQNRRRRHRVRSPIELREYAVGGEPYLTTMLHPTQSVGSGAPYVKFLPDFRRLFPGMDPVPLVASVLFYTPVVRDLVSWCGVRQVSPTSFHISMFPCQLLRTRDVAISTTIPRAKSCRPKRLAAAVSRHVACGCSLQSILPHILDAT